MTEVATYTVVRCRAHGHTIWINGEVLQYNAAVCIPAPKFAAMVQLDFLGASQQLES